MAKRIAHKKLGSKPRKARKLSKMTHRPKGFEPPFLFEETGKKLQNKYPIEYAEYKAIPLNYICTEWALNFKFFLTDMGPVQFNRHKLSRLDEKEKYNIKNCYWFNEEQPNNCLLAFDPGAKNFGACWIVEGRIKRSFMIEFALPYVRGASFDNDWQIYINGINNLLNKIKPNKIVIERFVPRRFGTNAAESINLMIGGLLNICHQRSIPIELLMASSWKNKVRKIVDLKKIYKDYKKQYKVEPHMIDAALIGKFTLDNHKVSRKTFKWLDTNVQSLKY